VCDSAPHTIRESLFAASLPFHAGSALLLINVDQCVAQADGDQDCAKGSIGPKLIRIVRQR
jgi:hypothetical protein